MNIFDHVSDQGGFTLFLVDLDDINSFLASILGSYVRATINVGGVLSAARFPI